MARLTVMQLLPALDGGGVERGTLEIASALVAAGHRSIVVSDGGRLTATLRASGTHHHAWPIGAKRVATLALVPRLRQLMLETGADIVHARSRVPAWIAWLAWRSLPAARRPKFVTTVHGLYSVSRYSAIMTRGDRVIAVSDAVRRYIVASYPDVAPDRIRVIHRGIDHAQYPYQYAPSRAWCEQWAADCGVEPLRMQRILLPGRLTRLKGHETFIDLIGRLSSAGRNVHGLIVGGEDPRRQAYARSLYNASRGLPITFLGHRTDLRELMSVADIVLSLSVKPESFGRTVLEALALGRPVVGIDHGGVGEILERLFPSGAVPVDDVNALVAKVSQFLDAPPHVGATDAYPLAEMQRATLSLYEELAAPRGG